MLRLLILAGLGYIRLLFILTGLDRARHYIQGSGTTKGHRPFLGCLFYGLGRPHREVSFAIRTLILCDASWSKGRRILCTVRAVLFCKYHCVHDFLRNGLVWSCPVYACRAIALLFSPFSVAVLCIHYSIAAFIIQSQCSAFLILMQWSACIIISQCCASIFLLQYSAFAVLCICQSIALLCIHCSIALFHIHHFLSQKISLAAENFTCFQPEIMTSLAQSHWLLAWNTSSTMSLDFRLWSWHFWHSVTGFQRVIKT